MTESQDDPRELTDAELGLVSGGLLPFLLIALELALGTRRRAEPGEAEEARRRESHPSPGP